MKDRTHRCQPTTDEGTFGQHWGACQFERQSTAHAPEGKNMQLRKAGVMTTGDQTDQAICRTVWKNVNRPGTHPRGDQAHIPVISKQRKVRKRHWRSPTIQSNFKLGTICSFTLERPIIFVTELPAVSLLLAYQLSSQIFYFPTYKSCSFQQTSFPLRTHQDTAPVTAKWLSDVCLTLNRQSQGWHPGSNAAPFLQKPRLWPLRPTAPSVKGTVAQLIPLRRIGELVSIGHFF